EQDLAQRGCVKRVALPDSGAYTPGPMPHLEQVDDLYTVAHPEVAGHLGLADELLHRHLRLLLERAEHWGLRANLEHAQREPVGARAGALQGARSGQAG